MILQNRLYREYSRLLSLGSENTQFLDRLCAVILALCPILQYYVGPVENAGVTILICVIPWFALKLLFRVRNNPIIINKLGIVAGLLIFLIYRSFIHGIDIKSVVFNIALFVLYVSAIYGCINIRHFIYTASLVAAVASILVVVQTAGYYVLHHHFVLAPTKLFTQDADAWVLLAKTGLIGVTQRKGTLYRPSAFFMEPSHMFLYCFPHLFLMLLSPDINKFKIKMAILYSFGLMLCTSGMGLVVTVGAWGLYFSMSNGVQNQLRLKNLLQPRNLLFVFLFLAMAVGVFLTVPVVRESIMRFLDLSNAGAIAGRTRLSGMYLKTLRGSALLFGVSNTTEGLNFNMSGFAATLYKCGILGVVLSYWMYVYGLLKLKQQFWWIDCIVIVASFFSAQTHGAFYMMYYSFILFEGWNSLTGMELLDIRIHVKGEVYESTGPLRWNVSIVSDQHT